MLRWTNTNTLRTAHRVYGKNVSEIARETGHSRNTVKKVLGEFTGYSPRKTQPSPVPAPITDHLQMAGEDIESPRSSAIRQKGIYTRLVSDMALPERNAVRHHVVGQRGAWLEESEAFVPLEPCPRGEAEVDWGSATVLLAAGPCG